MTARTILIGAGGTGSIIARPLVHYLIAATKGEYELVIADGDEVETKNLARQLFDPDAVGHSKAARLASSLPGHTTVHEGYIDDTNIDTLFRENDRAILAVDNFDCRRLIDAKATSFENFTVINPGNEDWTSTCQLHIRRGGVNVTPRISYMHPEITDAEAYVPTDAGPACGVRAVLGEEQTIAANMLAAAMALNALVAVDQFDLNERPLDWHETYYDLIKSKAGGPDWREVGDGTWA